ncbi:hypothetical protein BGZ96_001002 [Linnemannia gamsii]|uniref:F-box domain-containing protein n=1 Tax=Linnemannia gamsii TaxID=64522 RepID=A0ABQ7JN93_9FUNG|nr:hypothetical protein BGZ96_001002 [Linnemannia gamsii]
MPVERVPKKARLQEDHVALPTTPAGISPTEQGSARPVPATVMTRRRRLGAQSNVLRGHYQETDYKDPLVFFSEEIALHILELLTPGELAQCACVSRQWYRLVNDQMLWRRLFYKDQFIYPRGLRNAGRVPKSTPTGYSNTATITPQDRRNLKRKRTGPDPFQHFHRHRQDEHMVYGDPSSSSSNSNSCWKALYRLNHNWIAGKAQITSLSIQQLSHQDQLFFHPAGSSLSRDMEGVGGGTGEKHMKSTHSPIVQFQGPILLIASPGDMVHLWKIQSAAEANEETPGRDGSSSSASPSPLAPLESSKQPEFWQTYRSSREGTVSGISCLALDRSSTMGGFSTTTGWQKVMVGYDSGHFSIFEYLPGDIDDTQENTPTTLREIGNTVDLPAWSDVGGIQSASFLYPILTTCSDDGTISIYKIQEDHQHSLDHSDEPRHWCRLLHRLYGSSPLSPVEIELRPVVTQQLPPSNDEQDHQHEVTRPLWRALITFGLQLMDGLWTVRLQEIEFDEQFIRHSIETGVEDESDFEHAAASSFHGNGRGDIEDETYLRSGIPLSSAELLSARLESAGHAQIGTISAITISSPYVVTTHPDNTMNVFHMARPPVVKQGGAGVRGRGSIYPKPIRFRHLSTLYGHCGAVSSVAIESRSGRLVSASMDRSIKVWTMVGRNRFDQLEQRRVHQCALSMNDLNQSWTLGARVNREEGLGLVWVGTDDEKIVSMNSDGTVKVWLFS